MDLSQRNYLFLYLARPLRSSLNMYVSYIDWHCFSKKQYLKCLKPFQLFTNLKRTLFCFTVVFFFFMFSILDQRLGTISSEITNTKLNPMEQYRSLKEGTRKLKVSGNGHRNSIPNLYVKM